MGYPSWFLDPKPLYETSKYVTKDPAGDIHYVQVFQSIPALEPFYLEFEKNFSVEASYKWIADNKWVPVVGVILYLAFLVEGRNYMNRREKAWRKKKEEEEALKPNNAVKEEKTEEQIKKEKRMEHKNWAVKMGPLPALWDLFLALFSIIGCLRTVPHLLFLFTHMSFKETVCTEPTRAGYGDGAAGLWVMLFTVSKAFELIDTVLLILKGKEPIFLHWYHHVTVLLYTWYSYSARNPGLYFVAMNYTVHAVMYSYYFLQELKLWPKWLNPIFITMMQINQMFAGVGLTIAAFHFGKDPTCDIAREMQPWCAAMYSTYLYFFIEFFVNRFMGGSKKGKGAKDKKKSS